MMSSYKTYSASDEKLVKMLDEFVEIIIKTMKTGILDFKKESKYLLIILKGCGEDVKEFNWILNWDCDEKISQENFIKILKLMPNLTNLKLRKVKLEEYEIEENPRKKLKFDLDICKNLKSIDCDKSFFNFFSLNFTQNFNENSASKLLFSLCEDYDQLIDIKSPQTKLIKKLELHQAYDVGEEVKEILKFSNLEALKIMGGFDKELEKDFMKELSTLKNLKVLKFDECCYDYVALNWKPLEYFENLESLSLSDSDLDVSFLRDLKLKSLKRLSLKGCVEGNEFIFENLSINSPNLKVLKVHNSPHKINFYAKHFKNLERLHLEFLHSDTSSIELDTEIIHENLKEFKVSYFNSNDEINDLFEIVEIFPNLESIEAECLQGDNPFFANKNIFFKLNKLKNLKSLKFNRLLDINCCKDFIVDGELIDDLKSLSKKLKFYHFGFKVVSDKVRDYEKDYDDDGEVFPLRKFEKENFQLFLSYLREFFEVDCDGHRHICNLKK